MFDVYYYNPICRMIKLLKWVRKHDSANIRCSTTKKMLEFIEKNQELNSYISKYEDYYVWYLNNHITKKHTKALLQSPVVEEFKLSRKITRIVSNQKE